MSYVEIPYDRMFKFWRNISPAPHFAHSANLCLSISVWIEGKVTHLNLRVDLNRKEKGNGRVLRICEVESRARTIPLKKRLSIQDNGIARLYHTSTCTAVIIPVVSFFSVSV